MITLAQHIAIETEGERSPAQSPEAQELAALEAMVPALEESGIRRVENLLDGQMTRLVTTLTPDKWNAMGDVEKRNMARWLERRVKLFSERLCFVRRHLAAEPDVPAYLRHG